jgi:aminopeptidase
MYAAIPLQNIDKIFLQRGCWSRAEVEVELGFEGQEEFLLQYGNEKQLKRVNQNSIELIKNCDAYLLIRAPYMPLNLPESDPTKVKWRSEAQSEFSDIYFRRLGDGSMKRSLCQYPTEFGAKQADMSLEEYTNFILKSCYLDRELPAEHWKTLSNLQQKYVDYLNQCDQMSYEHRNWKINFRVGGRKWINSDGKSNMPSGEVFTSPHEDSVQGEIIFDYPSFMMGKDVKNVKLHVADGVISEWSAEQGQDVLDKVFAIEGARKFGEVAIGTNSNITRATRNILFDEKIGGTVHMAVGQSYYQCVEKINQPSLGYDHRHAGRRENICGWKNDL